MAIESSIDERGFGQPAMLFTFAAKDKIITADQLAVDFTNIEPVLDLKAFAHELLCDHDGIPEAIAWLIDKGTIGWLYAQEVQAVLNRPQFVRVLHSGEIHPESQQVRQLLGMDLLGRTFHCLHAEGEEPTGETHDTGQAVMSGTLPKVLHSLNRILAKHLPDAQLYLDALGTLEIRTQLEMIELAEASPPADQGA